MLCFCFVVYRYWLFALSFGLFVSFFTRRFRRARNWFCHVYWLMFFSFRSFRWTKKCAGRCTALNVWAHWIWTRTCRIWSVPRKCSPMTIANSWRNTCPPVLKVSNCVPSDCRQEKWDVTNVLFCQTGYPWTLVFSTSENGFSLSSLYRKMMGIDSPILLVIEDTQGNVSLSVWTA